jgi:hypothetical protein
MATSEIKKLFIDLTISAFNSSNNTNLDPRYFSITCLPVDSNTNADLLFMVYTTTLAENHYFYLYTSFGDSTMLNNFTYHSGDDNTAGRYTVDFIIDRNQFTSNQLESVCTPVDVLVTENAISIVTDEGFEIEIT